MLPHFVQTGLLPSYHLLGIAQCTGMVDLDRSDGCQGSSRQRNHAIGRDSVLQTGSQTTNGFRTMLVQS